MSLAVQADLEKFSQTDFQNEPDAAVTLWLEAASRIIENYCGRSFEEAAGATETLDGTGTKLVHLSGYPVTAVNSITEDGTALVDGTDFAWYADGRLIRLYSGDYDYRWSPIRKSIVVDYDYGYAAGSVPEDLVAVCCFLVERIFAEGAVWANTPSSAAGPISSLTLGTTGDQVSYASPNVAADGYLGGVQLLTPADRNLLAPYVRRI